MMGSGNDSIDRSLGLGPHLVGKQIDVQGQSLEICQQLGEGGFSFVYLVRASRTPTNFNTNEDAAADNIDSPPNLQPYAEGGRRHSKTPMEKQRKDPSPRLAGGSARMVLKITSVHNASQRQMAEKEAKLLQTLSHPSIVQVYDHGFRESHSADEISSSNNDTSPSTHPNNRADAQSSNRMAQHLILMEYCEGGTAFDAIKRMKSSPSPTPAAASSSSGGTNTFSRRFDLPSLVISFGQICNAVSYLHAQRPPIIHRDLKPVNFLIKNGAYKLCDFGSAVMGHTDLRTPQNRRKAEEIINKTTTQMFRAPEMVDLYMAKRLTQSTDVWALGCCLYSLAFLRDCFEEGSNLAILSRKYKIPDDNPYGEGLVDLIDRMLASDYKERADMSEVIMCLSALYSNRSLPKRKLAGRPREEERKGEHRTGAYRTDGQGISQKAPVKAKKKVAEAKKLDPKSAAAKRKKASEGQKPKTILPSARESSYGDERNGQNVFSPDLLDGGSGHQDFASFDHEFDASNLDNMHGHDAIHTTLDSRATNGDDGAFSSAFDKRCQISGASPLQETSGDRNRPEDGAFEVSFQGFNNSSSFSPPPNHNAFGEKGENPGNVDVTSAQWPVFQDDELQQEDPVLNGKKSRGSFFGILGRSSAGKF